VVGPGWLELAAAVGAPPVVMGRVLGQDGPQVPFAEDQHLVGDLGQVVRTNRSARARTAGRFIGCYFWPLVSRWPGGQRSGS
jgi:hypothetical protein